MPGMFGQQRSQSGGPALSINTGAANLFGSSNNASQPQSGGLFASKQGSVFGASSTATPSALSAGTLFGTSTTTQGSNLFGNTTTAPSQAGTLFGGSAMNNASNTSQSGGLFPNPATSQPSLSLFGNTATSQPQKSLFGNTTTSQPQTNSTFGSSLTSQPQQQNPFLSSTTQAQPGTGLFGSTNTQPQSTNLFGSTMQQGRQGGGLFNTPLLGQSQQNQQQQNSLGGSTQQPSLFGGSQNTQQAPFQQSQISTLNPPQQTQRSVFPTSIGQYTAAQQTVPGVRIDLSNLKPTTRFNDLYEGLQKEIENVDAFILKQMELQSECESAMPSIGNTITQMPRDVEFCTQKLEALERALENDAAAIDSARDLVRSEVDDARLSFKAIHSLRIPAQFQQSSPWTTPAVNAPTSLSAEDDKLASADLLSYFSKQADEMGRKLEGLTKNLREVESYLEGLEAHQIAQVQAARLSHGRDGGIKSGEEQVRELGNVLREFEGGILGVASKVGAAREGVQDVMLRDSTGRRGRS